MSFLDTIIQWDQQLLISLNNLGTESWDSFWLYITKPSHWWPLFITWLVLFFIKFNWKQALFFFAFLCITAGISDQLVNLIKYSTARPRPCWQEGIMEHIRILKCSHSFSFVSGHATTSMYVTTFCVLLLREIKQWRFLFYIYPVLFAYSRIYMGKHYPADILCGYTLGIIEAVLYIKLARFLGEKLFKKAA